MAAVLAIGGRALWLRRETWTGRAGLATLVAGTAVWSCVLLARNAWWHPELRFAIVTVSVLSAAGLLVPADRLGRGLGARFGRGAAVAALCAGLVAGLAGPGAYTVATAATAHSGSIPSVGPSGASSGMGGGPGARRQNAGGPRAGSTPPSGGAAGSTSTGGAEASTELVALLKASTTQWSAAVSGAQSAASLELASGTSVIGIGGFSNSDPAPSLAQFQQWVTQGLVHYYVSGGQGGPGGGNSGTASQISTWVAAHYTATTVGSSTVYDLTAAANS